MPSRAPAAAVIATVIGLSSANGHQRAGTGPQSIPAQKLKLAGLVATTAEAGQVISFHPKSGAGRRRSGPAPMLSEL